MVALLGLFKKSQILIEHLLLGEGDAVHTHKLFALFVAAPERPGERCYLGGLDRGGVRDVGTTAQVGERALCVGGDVSVLKFGYELTLVLLATVAKHFQRIRLGDVSAYDWLFLLSEFKHFFLDLGEFGGCELVLSRVDVIIEAVLDCRAYAEFHSGIQLLESLSEKVGRRMPERVLPLRVVPFVELEGGIFINGACEVPFFVIDGGCEHIASQLGRQAFSYLKRGGALFVLLYAAVRECDVYGIHFLIYVGETYGRLPAVFVSVCKGNEN